MSHGFRIAVLVLTAVTDKRPGGMLNKHCNEVVVGGVSDLDGECWSAAVEE